MDHLNALLMLSVNGPLLENEDEVLRIVEKEVANYDGKTELGENIILTRKVMWQFRQSLI